MMAIENFDAWVDEVVGETKAKPAVPAVSTTPVALPVGVLVWRLHWRPVLTRNLCNMVRMTWVPAWCLVRLPMLF